MLVRDSIFCDVLFQYHLIFLFFFFNDTATTEIYTLSLHDALPISRLGQIDNPRGRKRCPVTASETPARSRYAERLEEHTSELQSRQYLVCRLLLEKKKKQTLIKIPLIYLYLII